MKKWILLINRIAPMIKKLVGETERKIDELALRMDIPTVKQYEEILKLTDRKNLLINLSVLHDIMKRTLKVEEFKLLKIYAKGSGCVTLAQKLKLSPSAVFYRVNKLVEKVTKAYEKSGYGLERMEKDFSQLDCVKTHLIAITRRYRKKETELKKVA